LAAAVLIVMASASRAGDAAKPDAAPPAASPAAPSAAPAATTAPETKPDAAAEAQPTEADAAPAAVAPPPPPPPPAVKAEVKPEETPAPVAAAPAPEPKPAEKPTEKPLNSCAAKLEPVADAYERAHDSLLVWLRAASAKMDAADGKIADLKKLIAEKEGRITQLKLDSAQNNSAEAKALDGETRDLWAKLKSQEDSRKELCRALSSAAGREVRELNRTVLEQFDKTAQTP
jgi:outer membrane biosynthesis protein TonB